MDYGVVHIVGPSGSDLRRAIALARHRAPKCCTRRVIFSAPWSTHKQTRSKESDFSLSYSSLCPPKESDLSLSCHFQNLSTEARLIDLSRGPCSLSAGEAT